MAMHRTENDAEPSGWQEVDTRPSAEQIERQQAKEAELLRQKALDALKTIDRTTDFDAVDEEPVAHTGSGGRFPTDPMHKKQLKR